MELEEFSMPTSLPHLSPLAIVTLTCSTAQKGHIALTSGDAEVSAEPGKAGALSHGGFALGAHRDETGGWNIAGAGPGMGFAQSERGPEPETTAVPYLVEDVRTPRESCDAGPAAAMGAVGGAAAVGVPAAAATGCCCCVIL